MADPADTKPGQSQAPSNTPAVQHPGNPGTQVGAKARSSTEGDFKIPAQSASHRFLTSKKSKSSDTTHTRSASNASAKSKDSDQTNHFVGRPSELPSGLAQRISSEFEHVDIGELSGLNCEVGNTKDLDIVNIEFEGELDFPHFPRSYRKFYVQYRNDTLRPHFVRRASLFAPAIASVIIAPCSNSSISFLVSLSLFPFALLLLPAPFTVHTVARFEEAR